MKKIITFQQLENRVFRFKSSEVDRKYFLNVIAEFLKDSKCKTFSETLNDAIWERNGQGETSKYMYFNERTQRLRIDNDFFEWAQLSIKKLRAELAKMDTHGHLK